MNRIPIIGVMGSHEDESPAYSIPVGHMVARLGCSLLTGGGRGVMTKVSEAYCETPQELRSGRVIGIIPTLPDEVCGFKLKEGYPNPFVEVAIISPLPVYSGQDFNTPNRNHINILTSDIVIALFGNRGTTNEIELALRFGKPVILFRPEASVADLPQTLTNARNIDEVEAFVLEQLEKLSYKPRKPPFDAAPSHTPSMT